MSANKSTLLRALKTKNKKLKPEFNFIENTIVFSSIDTRGVPQESHVCFRIDPKSNFSNFCKLYLIDRKFVDIPLIPGNEIKPDYLCVYKDKEKCVFTIIELKGKGGQSHALDQILNLWDKIISLKQQYFPNDSKIHIQGLYLVPKIAELPLEKLKRIRSSGKIIVPLNYNCKFDIYDYVSRILKGNEVYRHIPTKAMKPNYFETLANFENSLPSRVTDDFENDLDYDNSKDVLLSFYDKKYNEYVTLYFNKYTKIIAYSGNESMYNKLKSELGKIGLKSYFSLKKI